MTSFFCKTFAFFLQMCFIHNPSKLTRFFFLLFSSNAFIHNLSKVTRFFCKTFAFFQERFIHNLSKVAYTWKLPVFNLKKNVFFPILAFYILYLFCLKRRPICNDSYFKILCLHLENVNFTLIMVLTQRGN